MSEPAVDAELIAALLDNRLGQRERERLLARLAASEEGFETFVEAATLAREMEGGDAAGDALPLRAIRRRAQWRAVSVRWLAAAAVVAGVAVSPFVWRLVHEPPSIDNARFVALLDEPDAGLPAGWMGHPWSASRGGTDALTPRARATRLGAQLVELELAVRARDSSATLISAQIVSLLEPIPASGAAIAIYEELGLRAASPPEGLDSLVQRGRAAAAGLVDRDLLNLGAWAEAGRIAVARHDSRFFSAKASRVALDRAARLASLPEDARRPLEVIRAALSTGGASDWDALERRLTELLGALGS